MTRLFDDTKLNQLRAEYAELRKVHSKNKSCEILVKREFTGVSTMWTYMETDKYGVRK